MGHKRFKKSSIAMCVGMALVLVLLLAGGSTAGKLRPISQASARLGPISSGICRIYPGNLKLEDMEGRCSSESED